MNDGDLGLTGPDERLMTADEVARILGVTSTYVRQAARDRRIPAYRLPSPDPSGRPSWRFRVSDIQEWIRERRQDVSA